MSTASTERIDSQRPRILRLYNLYRVILGFGLTLLTSSADLRRMPNCYLRERMMPR